MLYKLDEACTYDLTQTLAAVQASASYRPHTLHIFAYDTPLHLPYLPRLPYLKRLAFRLMLLASPSCERRRALYYLTADVVCNQHWDVDRTLARSCRTNLYVRSRILSESTLDQATASIPRVRMLGALCEPLLYYSS
jgi:hypothetical protein